MVYLQHWTEKLQHANYNFSSMFFFPHSTVLMCCFRYQKLSESSVFLFPCRHSLNKNVSLARVLFPCSMVRLNYKP